MKTILWIIGGTMLFLAGFIGYQFQGNSLGESREANIFRIDDNGYVITNSQVSGAEVIVPTGTAATSTGGTLEIETLYFVITSVDADGGETLPSAEFSCAVGSEGVTASVATSTACIITHTPAFGTVSRLWISVTSGTFTQYKSATSTVYLATTTSLTTATIPTTTGTAFDGLNVQQSFSYTATATAGDLIVKTNSGTLHSITVNTTSASSIIIYDGATCAGTIIGTIKASVVEQTLTYDLAFDNGLCLTLAGTSDITVSYK